MRALLGDLTAGGAEHGDAKARSFPCGCAASSGRTIQRVRCLERGVDSFLILLTFAWLFIYALCHDGKSRRRASETVLKPFSFSLPKATCTLVLITP